MFLEIILRITFPGKIIFHLGICFTDIYDSILINTRVFISVMSIR